eukprot:TRINITY_DN46019_c0_g1_i1.p1 TRINITY_DN46019_c0_g1~~TRINITY_DN46019_c0_g1_i1.p1  ORF type:complete len:246 (+),score=13.18 TRINITY_DN46019_c0_g1_i1:75-740(+)
MASNFLGPLWWFQLLASALAPGAKVMFVSSTSQWGGEIRRLLSRRIPWEKHRAHAKLAYADSKLAGVCFIRALRRRNATSLKHPVDASVFVPGNIDSAMGLPTDAVGPLGIRRSNKLWGWHAPAASEAAHLIHALFVHKRPLPDAFYSFFFPERLFLTYAMENRLPYIPQMYCSGCVVFLERLTYALHASAGPECNESIQEMIWLNSSLGVGFAADEIPVP